MVSKSITRPVSRVSGKVPLRIILVMPFVIQIFAAVGLVGWLSFRNGQKAVNDVASQLRRETSSQFTFSLPISQPYFERTQDIAPLAAYTHSPESIDEPLILPQMLATNTGVFKILVVDDEPINLQVLVNNLSL